MVASKNRRNISKKSQAAANKRSGFAQQREAPSDQKPMEQLDETSTSGNDTSSANDSSSESSESSQSEQDMVSGEEADDDGQRGTTFTDENAAWLKAKKDTLIDGDSSENDANSVSDKEDHVLEVERQAQALDEEAALEEADADRELRETIASNTAVYHLPTIKERETTSDRVLPPSELRAHVHSILEVLADFTSRREPRRSRQEYMSVLGSYLAELYGYLPELVEYFLTMFGPAETLEFVDASDQPRPLVIRTNTLKARRKDLAAALMKRGVTLDPLASWSKVGLKIVESTVPIGATPEYLSGQYMLQSAASMCPILALAPQPNEYILDCSAAPGGKTSYIAQLMRNTGVLLANDIKAERQKATVANLHRLGVKNVVACHYDARKLGNMLANRFDRVLLDAPCSGLGVISRDPSCKVQRTIADIQKTAHLQKELLLSAIDALKFKGTTGGVVVYSTCSVSVAENEEVVQYALSKRDVRIVDAGLDFGKPGFTRYQEKRFHPSIALTRRFYPHVHNMDGFFVAKIEKQSDKKFVTVEKAMTNDDVTVEGQGRAQKSHPEESAKAGEPDAAGWKRTKISVPPSARLSKKAKNDAKTSKPRRMKA